MSQEPAYLSKIIKQLARELGFDEVGIAPAVSPPHYDAYVEWLERGYAGEMHYLHRHRAARRSPQSVFAEAKSVVVALLSYNSASSEATGETGRISSYAMRRDYHHVIRRRLYALLDRFREYAPGVKGRAVVDTAPLLERDFAWLAGLGWIGKNTMLLNKRLGSYTFIGSLLLSVELAYDEPHRPHHCGTCTRCLEACPTSAFEAPFVLDARKCISYLTIELRDHVPEEMRDKLHGWLFGCDICQEVCPWNRKAPPSKDPELGELAELRRLTDPVHLLRMSDGEIERTIRDTPLERAGPHVLKRTAALLLQGRQSSDALEALAGALRHPDPIVRLAAAHSLAVAGTERAQDILRAWLPQECDPAVRETIQRGLTREPSAASVSTLNEEGPSSSDRA